MNSKESKIVFKEVREAIKSEKYAEAIQKCENLLLTEPKSYLGHLLLGAAYQSIDKAKAAKSLRQAVALSPGPPTVALQGLASCALEEELPKIYEQLLELLPEHFVEYCIKLVNIAENPSVAHECFRILKKASCGSFEKDDNKQIILKCLARLLIKNDFDLHQDFEEQLYKVALEAAIKDQNLPEHLTLCKRYLKLLYKLKELSTCQKTAAHIIAQYPNDIYAYEWICKIYCENYYASITGEKLKVVCELQQPIASYANKLLSLNENSSLGLLVQAIDLYKQQQFITARSLIQRVLLQQPKYSVALALLARLHMELGAYGMALPLWRQLDQLNVEYAVCLSYYENKMEVLQQGVALLTTLPQNEQTLNALARCYFKLKELDKLLSLPLADLTKAEFEFKSSSESLKFLQSSEETTSSESFNKLLLYGKLYLNDSNYTDALANLLKATRMRPHHSECFHYLAQTYLAINDVIRARKCFEKCINLNPLCEEAVNSLSAIYQMLGEEDLNLALLLNTLKYMERDYSKRIYYKLGLHYFNNKRWDDAIQSFRIAITLDVDCLIYWESLGSAYAERGSYNSAIRVFKKILETAPTQQYALLQLGLIKTTIRMYSEAIEDFDNLLSAYPNYLPGLKGAAEAHIGLANNLKLEHRYSRCKAHLQFAVNHLQCAFFSSSNHTMVWLWRLTATAFILTAQMPSSIANLDVVGSLANRETDVAFLTRKDLLQLAINFYTCALKLKQNTYLWYELAICCYLSADVMPELEKKHIEVAASACKMAIKEQSNRWHNWNLLGVVSMHRVNQNLSMAQHCFIQALTLERKSYTTWTNLGVLYLHLKEIKLANLAFQRAQQSSPIYPQAWIGQAMIAEEINDKEETIDLFRHCQQFEYHPESALGYVHWVCQMLIQVGKKVQPPYYKHHIEIMHADVVALDAINWYVQNEENLATLSGLSFQGLLNVHQGYFRPAVRAYLQAVKSSSNFVEQDKRDKMLTNLGYLYLKLKQPLEAINAFDRVTHASSKGIIGLALAYFRAGQHQQAYDIYNSILQSISSCENSEEDDKAAAILVAMAALVYASQGEADTKTILYQCILLKNTPIEALYSACALGIVHHDNQLSASILCELNKYETSIKHCAKIAFINSQYHLANKRPWKGLTYILKRVHIFPHCAALREVLSNFLLDNFSNMEQYQFATSQMSLSSISLNRLSKSKSSDCSKDAKLLLIASQAFSAVDQRYSLKLLQRAVHTNPEINKARITLLAAL